MREKQAIRYIVRIVLTAIGSLGIIRVLTSCALPKVSDSMVVFFISIDSIVCVAGLYKSKSAKRFLLIAGAIFGVLAFLCMKILKNGIRYIYNDCMYALEQPYSLNLGRMTIEETGNKALEENTTMIFLIFLIVLAVTLVVVYVHNMLGALLSILPMMIIFISMAAIPDVLSFFLCISYVFGVSALHGYVGGERQSIAVLVICGIVCVVSALAVPSVSFQRLSAFEKLNEEAGRRWNWVGNNTFHNLAAVANGGIGKGQLGKFDGIRYTNETVFTLTTIDIGKNQYFSSFIGESYADNQWSQPLSTNIKNDLKSDLVDLLDTDMTLRSYIDNGQGNYYEWVHKFPYVIDYKDGRQENGTYVSVDVTDYTGFKNALDYMKRGSTNYNKIKALYDYFDKERTYQENVYKYYLSVPEKVRDVVNSLMGSVTVTTEEQKEYYIKYVKNYLSANYTYNLTPGRVPEDKDFIEYFLMESKQGYCTYFASAAVMMYRCAGIPARYVEGYVVAEDAIRQGTPYNTSIRRYSVGGQTRYVSNTNYVLEVQDNAAHAWAEVYMEGYGWVPVEVTPSNGRTDTMDSFSNGQQSVQETLGNQENEADNHTISANGSENGKELDSASEMISDSDGETNHTPDFAGGDEAGGAEKTNRSFWNTPLFLIPATLLSVCAAVFLLILLRYAMIRQIRVAKGRKRNWKKLNESQLRQTVIQEYQYLEKIIAFAGFRRTKELEYEAYAGYLMEASDIFKKNDMRGIVELVLRIYFSEEPVSAEECRRMKYHVRAIREDIYRQQGLLRKFYFKYIKMF